MKTFGELLREARNAAGLTQLELAEKTKVVDHSYISTIERETAPPPARDKIIALIDALGITDKAKRASFLLAAKHASEEDLEGFELVPVAQHPSHSSPPSLANPAISISEGLKAHAKKDPIGKRIEQRIKVAQLSKQEEEQVAETLEAITERLLALIETSRQAQ
jgi:transcriptional regulator with XRE-family HTH domain